MNKKISIVIAIIVAAIIAGIIFFVYFGSSIPSNQTPKAAQAPQRVLQTTPQTFGNRTVAPAVPTQSTSSSPTNAPYIVTYTDSGFSPRTLAVPKGGTVIFKNSASDDMRVASNPHPIHNDYPVAGGCISSAFDSCKGIAPGQSWSFTFDIRGSWGYHNHLDPGEGGTIVVQ